jgi:hypothetical protein
MLNARVIAPSNGLQFTGANRDAMKQGSRSTVKQRLASGATACWTALCLRRVLALAVALMLTRGDAMRGSGTRDEADDRPALPRGRQHDYSTKFESVRTELRW